MNPLLTPRDWQIQAIKEATDMVGSGKDGYTAKMVEARRYGVMADELERQRANPEFYGVSCGHHVGIAAIKTLERLGYTYHGGELWKPPLGKFTQTDTDMLDWIESQGNGEPWVARQSGTGRGYRLHNDRDGKHTTAREAIAGAMAATVGINGLTEAETSASVMGLVTSGVGHKAHEWRGGYTPGNGPVSGSTDPLYSRAIAVVRDNKRGSISLVQRFLQIGYNRAACMLEAMEKDGIITPWGPGGTGREVIQEVERKKADDTEGGAL